MTLDSSPVWIKTKLMKKVKTVIKHPDGSIADGPPTSMLKRLDSSHEAFEKSRRIKTMGVPAQPFHHALRLESNHVAMGEAIGMPAYEIRDIMSYDFSQANEMVLAAFKKFIMLVKLSGAVDFTESLQEIKSIDESNARNRATYEKELQRVNDFNENRERTQKRHREELYQAWGIVIEDLYVKVSGDPKMEHMGEYDTWLVRAFALAVGTDVCKISKAGKVTMDLEKAKQVSPEIIGKLQTNATRLLEQHVADAARQAFFNVGILELIDKMWASGDADQFHMISEVVFSRLDELKMPVEDYQALTEEILHRREILDRAYQNSWKLSRSSKKNQIKEW